jgi:DNA-binding response OmpR family regulator
VTPVLLVEDVDVVRTFVRLALEASRTYAVTAVASGRDALAALGARPFRAAIIDCGLPDVAGLDLVTVVRQGWPDLPIIVVSADGAHHDEALRRGARAFVEKVPGPFAKELLAALEAALR